MLKGIFFYYILSRLTGNPFLALILLFVIYLIIDKAYLRLLPDFSTPFKRKRRIGELLKELKLNPANANNAQELGVLYFEKKKYSKALEYLKQAFERDKNSARLNLYMGMTSMELGQLDSGKDYLYQALEIDPKVGRGLPYIYLMQYELDNKGHKARDIEELEEGLERFANTENLFRMGKVFKKYGSKDKARKMFDSALEEYKYVPKYIRKLHRKWAIFARINKLLLG